jgi:hypothetical protein
MKRLILSKALLLFAASGALFLTSCATPEHRISQHPQLYQRLAPSDRALVSEGRIRNGMSHDAVFLAWGPPQQTSVGNIHGRPAETWIYLQTTGAYGGYGPSGYRGYYGHGGGFGYVRAFRGGGRHHFGYDPFFYDPFIYAGPPTITYPARTVSFQNGRVVAFQDLYPPRVY